MIFMYMWFFRDISFDFFQTFMVHAQPSSVCGFFFLWNSIYLYEEMGGKGGGAKKTPENGLHVKNRLKQRLQVF